MVIDFGSEGENTPIVIEAGQAVNSGASIREGSTACYTHRTGSRRNCMHSKTCGEVTTTRIHLDWYKLISANPGEQTL